MRKYLSPFILIFTLVIGVAYAYARYQLSPNYLVDVLLALPFLAVWLTPILFWVGEKSEWDRFQVFAYLSMGWLNFLFMVLIPLNLLVLLLRALGREGLAATWDLWTMPLTYILATLALGLGYLRAKFGPSLRMSSISLPALAGAPAFENLRIAQISDLHVGPTIHKPYVEKVVEKTNALQPDLIVLTGDIVDGSVAELREHVAPLAGLKSRFGTFLILGNHDYYSGAPAWIQTFESLGMTVLLNSHQLLRSGNDTLLLAGVLDPAAQAFSKTERPDPHAARGERERSEGMLRILLAHNPKIAKEAARAGFHLQLSGHTHAGQFVPWTWFTKLVHKPHYVGLSEEGAMKVYVSAGTGSWGPPIRLGTAPEITLLTLTREN